MFSGGKEKGALALQFSHLFTISVNVTAIYNYIIYIIIIIKLFKTNLATVHFWCLLYFSAVSMTHVCLIKSYTVFIITLYTSQVIWESNS